VYRVTSGSNSPDLVYAGHRECSTQSAGSTIRGFQITSPTSADHAGTGWRLAVTWEQRGLIRGETLCLDDIFQFATTYESTTISAFLHDWHSVTTDHDIVEKMDTAYFDRLISLDPPIPTDPHNNADIAQTFIQHLFYPGRFSTEDLETALTDYFSQPGRQLVTQLTAPSSSLSGRYESVVGCDLEMAIDPQTGAPVVDAFREGMKRDWLSIWARIRDLDKHSRYPLASTVIDGHVLVHTRAGLSAYITEDACGIADRSGSSEDGQVVIELPESSFATAYPQLDTEVRRSTITVSTAGSYIASRLDEQESSEGSRSVLKDLMDHIDLTLATSETEPIESRCEALWDDMIEPYFGEEDQLALRRVMSNTSSEREAISHTLDLLANDHNGTSGEDMDTSSNRVLSGSGNALLTSSIASTVQCRYALARKVLLVALYHLTDSGLDGGDDGDEFEEVISVVNRAFCVYHRYRVLRWLCEQTWEEGRIRIKTATVPRHRNEGEESTALQRRSGTKMQDGLEVDGTDPSYSLLHSLLASHGTATPISGFSLLYDASQAYLVKIDLVDGDLVEVEPRDQDVILAHSVLMDGHADTARRITELYPLSAGTAYIRGRALVETGAFDESVDYLKQAASGCRGESYSMESVSDSIDGSLASILPFTSKANGESDYYAHVSSLYGDAGYDGPAIYFGQLALRSSNSTPSKALYTRIFLSNIALGNYEDAYSILTATSSEEL
jgi:nuclear pore complex protein Nup160